ncbi:hypothetical protein QNI19_27990, partial [Cytophagaceae bacterium DM2B3-1]|nr:hypothetical protein [Xanthocytophaga flavus]
MNPLKYCVGIDVAKDSLKVCLSVLLPDLQIKVKASTQFANTEKGFELFWAWVNKHYKHKVDAVKVDAVKACDSVPLHFLLEATGIYHEKIAWFLYAKQTEMMQTEMMQTEMMQTEMMQVHVILANKARAYLKSMGYKSKNDKLDAKGLA